MSLWVFKNIVGIPSDTFFHISASSLQEASSKLETVLAENDCPPLSDQTDVEYHNVDFTEQGTRLVR